MTIYNKEVCIAIAGCKEFYNYSFFEEKIYEIISPFLEKGFSITIRERELYTVDNFAVRFALENNFNLERYKIDWNEKGKSAGIWANKAITYGREINEQRPSEILIVFITNKMKENKLLEHLLEEFSCCVTCVNELKEPDIYVFCED